jgi:hypothetical protein
MKFKFLFQLFAGFAIAFCLIYYLYSGTIAFENLALGTQTSTYKAVNEDSTTIHCLRLNQEFICAADGNDHYKTDSLLLILGNSQSHSINQLRPHQTTYTGLLNERPRFKNRIITCSFPNANMQEYLLLFNFWTDRYAIRQLVLPAFFDDYREDGIRDVFIPYIIQQQYVMKDTTAYIAQQINQNLRTYWKAQLEKNTGLDSNNDQAALKQTVQESIEFKLNQYLDNHLGVWSNRANVRGTLFNYLYMTRNTILGINASTIRPIIKDRYDKNMEALKEILRKANKLNIKVLLYVPPIRSDFVLPYNINDYAAFKKELAQLVIEYPNVVFRNFESCIPGSLWGYKEATNLLDEKEIDYMHFQYKGHQILADSLFKYIQF